MLQYALAAGFKMTWRAMRFRIFAANLAGERRIALAACDEVMVRHDAAGRPRQSRAAPHLCLVQGGGEPRDGALSFQGTLPPMREAGCCGAFLLACCNLSRPATHVTQLPEQPAIQAYSDRSGRVDVRLPAPLLASVEVGGGYAPLPRRRTQTGTPPPRWPAPWLPPTAPSTRWPPPIVPEPCASHHMLSALPMSVCCPRRLRSRCWCPHLLWVPTPPRSQQS